MVEELTTLGGNFMVTQVKPFTAQELRRQANVCSVLVYLLQYRRLDLHNAKLLEKAVGNVELILEMIKWINTDLEYLCETLREADCCDISETCRSAACPFAESHGWAD